MASAFLSAQDKKEIATAIQEAEKDTIGEIRIFIEKKCAGDPLHQALNIFHKLKMQETKAHSGVLIYVAHDDHKLAIAGDSGIHSKVPENFWDEVKNLMTNYFSEGRFAEGLKNAIAKCGENLKKHFPLEGDNPNELSNDVVIENE